MDVDPERALEQHRRDEQPVRADDDRARRDPYTVVELCRLFDGNAEPLRNLLRGWRSNAPPTARRLVGPSQELDDFEVRRKPLEDVGAEGRGRGD